MWFDVLANYDEYADILEESPFNPSEYISYNIAQVRFNNSDYAYSDLAADIQQSLYWSSGTDAFLAPTVTEGRDFYIAFY
jgi:hypothetical protein